MRQCGPRQSSSPCCSPTPVALSPAPDLQQLPDTALRDMGGDMLQGGIIAIAMSHRHPGPMLPARLPHTVDLRRGTPRLLQDEGPRFVE